MVQTLSLLFAAVVAVCCATCFGRSVYLHTMYPTITSCTIQYLHTYPHALHLYGMVWYQSHTIVPTRWLGIDDIIIVKDIGMFCHGEKPIWAKSKFHYPLVGALISLCRTQSLGQASLHTSSNALPGTSVGIQPDTDQPRPSPNWEQQPSPHR